MTNSANNKSKKEYVKILILLSNILFLFLINKSELIKANAGKNIGKNILLFSVGRISIVKFDLQFVLSKKSI